jgi:hypothetical protein
MVKAILSIDNKGNRILNIIKAKENFKNKSEALNFILDQYGKEVLEPELRPEFIKELLESQKKQTVKIDDWDKHFDI